MSKTKGYPGWPSKLQWFLSIVTAGCVAISAGVSCRALQQSQPSVQIEWGYPSTQGECADEERHIELNCLNLNYEIRNIQQPYILECHSNPDLDGTEKDYWKDVLWQGEWSGKRDTGCYFSQDSFFGNEDKDVMVWVKVNGVVSNSLSLRDRESAPPSYPG